MIMIDVEQAPSKWLDFLRRVEQGETVVFTRNNQPIAELKAPQLRPIGLSEGDFVVPADFDAPLPDELLDLFEGA